MGYTKTIVCFANSRKLGGRCIAGKEWLDGNPGEWVRPVSHRETQEVSDKERCYENGKDPLLLDIINVQCERHYPASHQRENHIIDPNYWWERRGQLKWQDIQAWLDNPDTLWTPGESSYYGRNDRVSIGREDGISLYLIAVERLQLSVGIKAPEYPDSKRAVRGEFAFRGIQYIMAVTDPAIEADYLARPDGQYEILRPALCVSLGDEYRGHFYKLISAVLYSARFK